MRKSPSSIATLRSRLRTTHSVLEELVIIKVAANGIRERAVLKAISALKDNALIGDEKLGVSPGLLRLHNEVVTGSELEDMIAPSHSREVSSMLRIAKESTKHVVKQAA